MSIFEFDEEREMKLIRADERELGVEEGKKIGLSEGEQMGSDKRILQFVEYDLSQNVPKDAIIKKLINIFRLNQDEIDHIIQQVNICM